MSHSSSSFAYATVTKPTTYTLTATDSMGCVDKGSVRINLFPETIIKAKPRDTSVCLNETIRLFVSGAKTYLWVPGSEFDSSNSSSPELTVKHSGKYFVSGTDLNGCVGYDSISIHLLPNINVVAEPKNEMVCPETKLTLHASGATSYKWFPSKGLNNDSISNPDLFVEGECYLHCKGYGPICMSRL